MRCINLSSFTYLMGLVATDGYLIRYKDKIKHAEIECTEEELLKSIADEYNIQLHYRSRVIKDKVRHFWRVILKDIIPNEYLPMFDKYRTGLFEYYKTLNSEDKNDFILGIWDGDGSICKGKDDNIRITLVINSQTKSLIDIIEDFTNNNNIKISKYFDKRGIGCYNYSIFKNSRLDFLKLMYSNKNITSIERKRNNANELLQQENSKVGV